MSSSTLKPIDIKKSTAVAKYKIQQEVLARLFQIVGIHTIRFGLVIVLFWIGGMKFTTYEAEGISGFVTNSPIMSWVYSIMSTQHFSSLLGIVEIFIGLLIGLRWVWPKVSAIGSLLAFGMFVTTLSFMLSTPGVIEPSVGFPGLSVVPGQFLVKDVVLLGASFFTLGEALRAEKE